MIRRRLGVRRAGHAGTLDPFATGLLLVLVGRATRLSQYLVGLDKGYEGEIALGVTTTTDDRMGDVVATSERWRALDEADVVAAFRDLAAVATQRPPVYSAKKLRGVPAYALARTGVEPPLEPRPVTIHELKVMGQQGSRVRFTASVGSGTYIRAIARDLGERLGCGAHLAQLRRATVGSFSVGAAVTPEEAGPSDVRPMLEAVSHLPQVELDEAESEQASHGHPLTRPAVPATIVALVSAGELLGIAHLADGFLKPRVVLRG